MTDSAHRIPDDEWVTIVRNVPIVSVDLVVPVDGGVVLGRRQNEPAKGEWFVPGGTVRKHERLEDAARRVAREELGVDVALKTRLGTYEHFYDTADVEGANGKHYVPTAFVARPTEDGLRPDDQHDELRVFSPPLPELHPHVERYLRDAGYPVDHDTD